MRFVQQDRATWLRAVLTITATSESLNPPSTWHQPLLVGSSEYPSIVSHILQTPSPTQKDFKHLFARTKEDGGDMEQQVPQWGQCSWSLAC